MIKWLMMFFVLMLVPLVTGATFSEQIEGKRVHYIINPFDFSPDYIRSENFTGENITADSFIGNGSELTSVCLTNGSNCVAVTGNSSADILAVVETPITGNATATNNSATQYTRDYIVTQDFYNSSKINTTQLQEQSDNKLGILWSWFVSSWLDRFNVIFPAHNTTLVTYIDQQNTTQDTQIRLVNTNLTSYDRANNNSQNAKTIELIGNASLQSRNDNTSMKVYVDQQNTTQANHIEAESGNLSAYVVTNNDTMTTFVNDKNNSMKQYVDDTKVNITGDTMTGGLNITVNGNAIFVRNSTGSVIFVVDALNQLVGIGTIPDGHTLDVHGDVEIEHTATENDDHAIEIVVDAAGFGDVKGIDIDYITGAISAGEDEEVILINIDDFLATGGDVVGLEILTTEGGSVVTGLEVGVLVNPIEQLSGVFGSMDSALTNASSTLPSFISTTNDTAMFISDNDNITLGNIVKFEEIEIILNTTASGSGIKPDFYFSTGIGTWTQFSPADGTNGMKNTGLIAWLDSDIPTWAVGVNSEFLIRIDRTANSLNTVPIEELIQIASAIEYHWNKTGDLEVRSINAESWINVTITTLQISGFVANNNTLDTAIRFINSNLTSYDRANNNSQNVKTIELIGNSSRQSRDDNTSTTTRLTEGDTATNNSATKYTRDYVVTQNFYNKSKINTTQLQEQTDTFLGIKWSWFTEKWTDLFTPHNTTLVTYIDQQNTTQDTQIRFINTNLSSYIRDNNATQKTYIDDKNNSMKQYVDDTKVNITGDTMTGNLNISANLSVGTGAGSLHTLDVHGDVEIEHTSIESDDHAVELIVNAAGFGDVKGIFIDYITGALASGEDEEIIFINLDQFLATGGHVAGFEIVTTEGGAEVTGLEVGVQVGPIDQLSGIFGNMDSALRKGDNALPAFISTTNDTSMFVDDDDNVTIGNVERFEEIEFILDTVASGAGVKPIFLHSTGVNTWTEFSPGDGTNGFRDTGVIIWEDTDIPTWAVGLNSEFLIRIQRTANGLSTVPIEDKVQIAVASQYHWNKTGELEVKSVNAETWRNVTITTSQVSDFLTVLDTQISGNVSVLNDNLTSYDRANNISQNLKTIELIGNSSLQSRNDNTSLRTYVDQQNTTQQNHIEAESGNLSAYIVSNNVTLGTYIDQHNTTQDTQIRLVNTNLTSYDRDNNNSQNLKTIELIGNSSLQSRNDNVSMKAYVDQQNTTVTTELRIIARANSTEQIQDAAWDVTGGTQTLITVTYQDGTDDVDFVVTDTLSSYTNDAKFIANGTDGLINNLNLTGFLGMDSSGNATVFIRADTDNSGEHDNPRVEFHQDGSTVAGSIGIEGPAGKRFVGSTADSLYLVGESAGGFLNLGGQGKVTMVIGDTEVDIENGAMCIGINGCTSPSTNGSLLLEGDLQVEGGDILTGTIRFGTTSTSGRYEFEDAGVCIGDAGCGASSTDGTLYAEVGISIDPDGSTTLTSGTLRIGDTTSTSEIEMLDGYMNICSGGCTEVTAQGGAHVEGAFRAGTLYDQTGFSSGNNVALCESTSGSPSFIRDCSGTPADYAEWYRGEGQFLQPGDVLTLKESNIVIEGKKFIATKITDISQEMFGVISFAPYTIIGQDIFPALIQDSDFLDNITVVHYNGQVYVAIALAGRVPVKASNSNGIIKIGDKVTSSGDGRVIKLPNEQSGQVLGIALTSINLSTGMVEVKIDGYYHTSISEVEQMKSRQSMLQQALCSINPAFEFCSTSWEDTLIQPTLPTDIVIQPNIIYGTNIPNVPNHIDKKIIVFHGKKEWRCEGTDQESLCYRGFAKMNYQETMGKNWIQPPDDQDLFNGVEPTNEVQLTETGTYDNCRGQWTQGQDEMYTCPQDGVKQWCTSVESRGSGWYRCYIGEVVN